jgi:AraC family transcriptional regulator
MHQSWDSIYRDWLPASGVTLRDAPPLELMLNDPASTAPADLLTELWIPVT